MVAYLHKILKKMHKYKYKWQLSDKVFKTDKGTVFSCFAGGGGSTMGYKLSGFDVLGCNEIDPKMMQAYISNHSPKYSYLEAIQTFKLSNDLPAALYDLDILDGSPPCSSFSISGKREKSWGKKRKFKEGQSMQVLDTLFFDFIDLAKKLQPKVVIAENVKGLLMGKAKDYVRQIYRELDLAGYYCQHWLLNAATMGVPQRRERVFFIALRKDLAKPFLVQEDMFTFAPKLNLSFSEPVIRFGEIYDGLGSHIVGKSLELWNARRYGDISQLQANLRLFQKQSNFGQAYAYLKKVAPTLSSKNDCIIHYDVPKKLSKSEIIKVSSFPSDYNFCGVQPMYICGMSVPPIMVAQVADAVFDQWLKPK
jgi:DNA (cytosine-5)-methyltransferase 1